MLGSDRILLQRPDSDGETTRVQGDIVLRTSRIVMVAVPIEDGGFQAGNEVLVYFDRCSRFVQQATRIVDVCTETERQVVTCEFLGEPIATEFRHCYRVSTMAESLSAEIGDADPCRVMDVSTGGVAVILEAHYSIGDVIPCALDFRGEWHRGTASVQGAKGLDEVRTRYGLSVHDDDPDRGQTLSGALTRISQTLQREQLSRLASKV